MAYPYQTGYNQVMTPVYGGYGQQPLQPQEPMCRMVSSREEASSTPVDFSGSLMVFADIQNNRIYTKRWDAAAGAARFGEYIPAPPPQPAQNGTRTATDPVLTMLQQMQAQLNGISERLTAAGKKEEPAE